MALFSPLKQFQLREFFFFSYKFIFFFFIEIIQKIWRDFSTGDSNWTPAGMNKNSTILDPLAISFQDCSHSPSG